MSAPAREVMQRAARLERMREAGVPDPIRFVQSARATSREIRKAKKEAEHRKALARAAPTSDFCPWCGQRMPCRRHRDLDGLLADQQGRRSKNHDSWIMDRGS